MQKEDEKKIKILAWGDYCCSTGFATVMSNIMMELEASGRYEIDVVGINWAGDPYNRERFPGRVWPAMPGTMAGMGAYSDVYGRQRVLDRLATGEYDVLFMLQDTFVVEEFIGPLLDTQEALNNMADAKKFKIVYYFPIDAQPKPKWATDVVAKVDYPVAYTQYAKNEILKYSPELKDKLDVIYHGTNLKDFYPIQDKELLAKFRKEFFKGKADDRFLLTNINRNQPRKDVVRNLLVLKELKKRGHNPLMYLHMQHSDVGGNILVMAEQLGLSIEEDFTCPTPEVFSANSGLPIEAVNLIYNVSDAIFSPTLGEGWGLSITEAMATKTPVIAPNHTSLTEMLAENRGYPVDSGDNPSAFIVKELDMERIRPLMNVEKAAEAVEKLMAGKLPDIEGAYKWVTELSWANLCKQWIKIIDKAALDAQTVNSTQFMSRQERRKLERKKRKAN